MGQISEAQFLDKLYAAPLNPALWVAVMEDFADLVGGSGAWLSRLSVANGTGGGIIARIDPDKPGEYLAHYAGVNPFSNEADPQGYIARWEPRIRFFADWLTREEVERTEYYNDFLRPQDIHSSMMLGLAADGLETCVLSINRSHKKGDFNADEIALARRLHPHFRRAFDMACRLELNALVADDLAAIMDGIGHGVLLVDSGGKLRFATAKAEVLLRTGTGLRIEQGRLAASQPRVARQLEHLIGRATIANIADRAGGAISVAHPESGAWLAVTIDPLPDRSLSLFRSERLAMVCLSDPLARPLASDMRLQQLFGLTQAEVRIAQLLLEGASPREAAERLDVRYQTVRNQMQGLYQKTMTSRQSDLVLLLSRVCAPATGLPLTPS